MNRVVKLNVNAVMVNVPVTDVKRASPATAVVNVHVVKKYAAALNNMSESSPALAGFFVCGMMGRFGND